jgi:succinoglycan biosynthesis protein ExoO
VLPAWGAHVAYVPEAIASLQEQQVPLEIVVVDNASDPPVTGMPAGVRVVRSETRLTPGGVRNFGLDRATGDYVMFWDVDDLMLPGALQRMLGIVESDPEVVAVTMDSIMWTPQTGPGERWPWPRPSTYRMARHRRLFALACLLHNPFTTTGPALMRMESVRDSGGFEDIAYFEDWALSASLAVRGRVVMLEEPGRLYRVHDQSLSLGHLESPQQGEWLTALRARTMKDPAVPLWMKALQPAVWLHHFWRRHRKVRSEMGAGYYKSTLETSSVARSASR